MQRNANLVDLEKKLMPKTAPTLAIVAVHTNENEPSRVQVIKNKITCTHYLIPRTYLFLGLRSPVVERSSLVECSLVVTSDGRVVVSYSPLMVEWSSPLHRLRQARLRHNLADVVPELVVYLKTLF